MWQRHLLLLELELLLDVLVVIVVVGSSRLVGSLAAFVRGLVIATLGGSLATLLRCGCLLCGLTSLLPLELLKVLAVEKVSSSTTDGSSVKFVSMTRLMVSILGFPLGEMIAVKSLLG